ncbi:MAG: 30S ribosomal protein S5 [Dehalococcoidia bacterium]|nr:30S ribosomal protein S5 [Dehalococcoidia bacterium]
MNPERVTHATERVVMIRRITKVTAGGKHMRFNALAALGDGEGHVGLGLGKADAVPDAVRKAVAAARKGMITIPLQGSTIPHDVEGRFDASHVVLRPAVPGTGVVAGATVRAVVELAGVKDILTKSLGSPNRVNLAKATLEALASLRTPQEEVAKRLQPLGAEAVARSGPREDRTRRG